MVLAHKLFPYNKELKEGDKALICFHHAGGTGAAFWKWIHQGGQDGIAYLPIELSGHGHRRAEELPKSYQQLVEELLVDLPEFLMDKKYSFFGHSMGAALAFSLEHRLEKDYGLQAEKVIVAGRFAPMIEDPGEFRISMGDEALLKEMKELNPENAPLYDNREFMEFFLPVIRRDYAIHEEFAYQGERIKAPISAHCGSCDPESSKQYMKPWEEVTQGDFTLKEFQGNHFFPYALGREYQEEILRELLTTKRGHHEMD